jgi:hypothetical protein
MRKKMTTSQGASAIGILIFSEFIASDHLDLQSSMSCYDLDLERHVRYVNVLM